MTPEGIKEYIIINEKIEYVLNELGCKGVKAHDNYRYYTGGFPDSKGTTSFTLFSDNLYVDSYTRNIKDEYGISDIISMVRFIKSMGFSQAKYWLCEILGIDYYSEEIEDIPMSLQLTSDLLEMNLSNDIDFNDLNLAPINENILDTYYKCGNDLFLKDGISLHTQKEFEIGIDLLSERITIPIRDEIGTLVGVKGRQFSKIAAKGEKYIYLEPCSKSKILYGLYKTDKYIREIGSCIVVESEKSVLALWENGYKNAISIGGHNLSRYQVEKITRLGVKEVILCYDSDVGRLDNGKINKKDYLDEAKKFIDCIKITAMVDLENNILGEKESPVDNMEKFKKLYENRKVLQNGERKNNEDQLQ